MKKSLLIRWSIILLVIVAWTWSMFPLQDSDYLDCFRQVSAKQVEKHLRAAGKLGALEEAEGLRKQLSDLDDKKSEEYQALEQQLKDMQASEAYLSQAKLPEAESLKAKLDYQELMQRVADIQKQDSKISGYKALERAANAFIKDYRDGKLGRFTFENPPE